MRKDFRRKLALFMAGCLVLGSLQMTGFTVQASELDEAGTDVEGVSVTDSTEDVISDSDSTEEEIADSDSTEEDGSDVDSTEEDGSDVDSAEEDSSDAGSAEDVSSNVDSTEEDGSDADSTEDMITYVDGTDEENSVTEVTYRLSDLDLGNYYGVVITQKESKETQFHYEKQYQQANYAIPQAVKDAGLIKVTCNVTSGSENLSLKLINEAQDKDVEVNYGQTSIPVGEAGAEGLGYVGLMSLPEGESDITIRSITFTVSKPVVNPPVYEEEVTYRISDLSLGNKYGVVITPKGSKETQFHYEKQYQQANYAIPQAVKDAGLIKVTCNVTSGSENLSLKLINEAQDKDVEVNYGQTSISVGEAGAEGLGYVGLMSLPEGESDITISSITFTVSKPVANPPVYDDDDDNENERCLVYTAEDLGAYGRWNNTPVELTDGKLVLTFAGNYEEFCLDLPKTLDMANCESITIRTADQNGSLGFKVYDSGKNELKAYYGNSGKNEYTFTPDFTGKATCIGVMSMDGVTSPFTSQIVSISFVMKDVPPDDTSDGNIYPAETLKAYERWSGSAVALTDGKLILSYDKQWHEYCLDLPEVLDMSNCENITIKTADQNAILAFKVYDGGKEELNVYYGNTGKNEYSFVPNFSGKAACIGIMSMDDNTNEAGDAYESPRTVQIVSIEFKMNDAGEEIELGDNLIQNPNFADAEDLAVWGAEQGGSTITAEVAAEAVVEDFKTYGKITNRGSNYNCFAQDITNVVKKNKEYQYTFYVMLDPEDYKDTEDKMRTVAMAPFIIANGEPNYSCNLTGNSQQVLEPGVWTKFSGTFTPSWTGELDKVVIRILEQGTEYGSGPGVMGTYYTTGVELRELIVPEKEIQTDVPNLKDAVTKEMGDDFIMGVSIVTSELSDDLLMQLVTKHFNAVTLGNELKPDAMFGYASKCPGTETASINGQEIQVPKLDYSRAEMTLNAIYDWNQEHPDDFIKVRGHVLVWHSQTPEWFFHEDYDADKPYVDKDTMNLRLEWYIKTMAEHFTGPGSKYEGMFYGWDVVNEAVSDGRGTYRNDEENSSWWAVYQSNEFILNAFTYANKYMPASVELYYNDYNEWYTNKRNGIVQLLKDVKAKEGARIDGMGMQGHYQTNGSPTAEEFEAAARAYCEVVGQVQITELDMAASSSYDGTKATLEAEYQRQAKRYEDVYTSVRRLKEEGYKVGNITVWGVIDKNSWLQTSSSVGGGTDGTRRQCPLLFDDNYQVKPCYWIFIDPEPLKPAIHKLSVIQTEKDSYDHGVEQTYTRNGTAVSFVPVWNDKGISVQVKVSDTVKDAEDKVTLYLTNADGTILTAECLRANAKETEGGYIAVVSLELDSSLLKAAATVGFDIVVTNGSQKAAYNDTTLSQATSSEYFAIATLKPYTVIPMGTAAVDGVKESSWDEAVTIPLTIRLGAEVDAQVSLLWDQEYLYVFAEVKDSVLDAENSQAHQKDSLEIFIDENNHKSAGYEDDDKQYRVNYLNEHSFNGPQCKEENIVSEVKITEDGYVIEAAIKWTDIKPANNMEIGLELQINDAAGGKRIGTLSWYDESGQGWSSPGVFGTAMLKDPAIPDEPNTPAAPSSSSASSQDVPKDIVADWAQITADLSKELSALKSNTGESRVFIATTGRGMVVPARVLQMLRGRNLEFNMDTGENLAFSFNGLCVPRAIVNKDLDLSVSQNKAAIPTAVIESTCKDVISYRQISMINHGDFGVIVNMHVALGSKNAGKYANLYRYDAQTGKLLYAGSFRINDRGQAMFCISRGADYLITITNEKPNGGYTVVKGDNLTKIAARFGIRLRDLIAANPQIRNKNRIYIGDQIVLP